MARLTRRARKDLDRLPARLLPKAHTVIRRLDDEPTLGKKLLGPLQGKRSVYLGRSHRIIYTMVKGKIVVLTIRARKDAYR